MWEHKFLKEQSCDQSSFNLYLVFGKLTKNGHNNEVKIFQNCNSFFPCGTWKSNIWWNSLVLYVTQAWCNKVRKKIVELFLKCLPFFPSYIQARVHFKFRFATNHAICASIIFHQSSFTDVSLLPPYNNFLASEFQDLKFTICSCLSPLIILWHTFWRLFDLSINF